MDRAGTMDPEAMREQLASNCLFGNGAEDKN
jgi:hypothetical protein